MPILVYSVKMTPGPIKFAIVSDGELSVTASFYLHVTEPNTPPTINAIPTQNITAGSSFMYRVSANDVNNDRLTYSLDADSLARGMTIDTNGIITWIPGIDQITDEPFEVIVSVSDGKIDEPVTTAFNVNVVPDTIAPVVDLTASKYRAQTGETITLVLNAFDNVGVTGMTLILKSIKIGETTTDYNTPITLTGNRGTYTIPAELYGTITFAATATDAQGNASDVSEITIQAIDPSDTVRPTVNISSPVQNDQITGPTDIIGTVSDNEGGVQWTLFAYCFETGKTIAINNGTGNVVNGVLGRFDTTMLKNGAYQIILEATDVGGNTSDTVFNVQVNGYYKLGNFTMSFTDFDLQLSGLPITLTRTYDTLNENVKGDFGYGWTLDINQYKLTVDYGDGNEVEPSPTRGLQNGDILYFTLPDGTKEGFVFNAQPITVGYWQSSYYYKPVFTPLAGTKSTFLYDGSQELMNDSWGGYTTTLAMGDNYPYTPFNAFYGGLSIELRNGTILDFDQQDGLLVKATELNGNSLTFSDYGVTHSSGKSVVFERDFNGRITRITGPDGNSISYSYDSIGNLVAVTDASGSTVSFTYLDNADHPHYLDTVIDPLGNNAAKTEYDDQGRIKRTIDADGKVIEYDFDTESRIQRVTDQLGNVTIIENDANGNVIKETSPGGAITLYTYDGNGNTLTETKVVIHNGEEIHLTTSYTYDSNDNKLSETDPRGNATYYSYNEHGQVVSTISSGVSSTTVYTDNGLPTYTVDANGNRTDYAFNDKGNLTGLTNSNGVTILNSTYNKYGEVTSTYSSGRTTYFDYDINGDCISTWYYDGSTKIASKTRYNEKRQVVGQEQWIGETLLWSTSTLYNATDQVIEEIDRYGLKTQHTYDNRGLEPQSRWQVKDTDGNIVWYAQRTVYDAAGKSIYSTDSFREGTTEPISGSATIYDADGNVIESKSLLGLVIDSNCKRTAALSDGLSLQSVRGVPRL